MYNALPESQHIDEIVLPLERIFLTGNSPDRKHFGILSYNSQVTYASDANLDDEIQGFPGIQYLPYVDFFLEQDNLKKFGRQTKHHHFLQCLVAISRC